MLDILYTSCSESRVKILTKTLRAYKNSPDAASESLIQYFISDKSRPTGDTYGGQFLLVKQAIFQRAIYILTFTARGIYEVL